MRQIRSTQDGRDGQDGIEFWDQPSRCPVMAVVRAVGRRMGCGRRQGPARGFTLVELLVVLGVVTLLMGILLPSLSSARRHANDVLCQANLRQMGHALWIYVGENDNRLPVIVEPLYIGPPRPNFNADPFSHPDSFGNFLRRTLRIEDVTDILRCPSAVLGYPRANPVMTYRVSSANNVTGQVRTVEQLMLGGVPNYFFPLKYLNGRQYRLQFVDPRDPTVLRRGVGFWYLVRDMVGSRSTTTFIPLLPHRAGVFQLRLDFSVTSERERSHGLSTP